MSFWDTRYSEAGFAYGIEPNDFLKAESYHIPPGTVLCLAEGEGRNAVYLAGQGYQVTATDQSEVGLEKAQKFARNSGSTIVTTQADLATFDIEPSSWDGIVSISAHVPPSIRKRIHCQVVEGLRPGGVFILEAYVERQLEMSGTGGPPPAQKDLFMSLKELREELAGLEFIRAREIEREINEGRHHQGLSAVVQVVAKRA